MVDGDRLLFVDNTGFDKIADRSRGVMVCAGSAMLIQQWKTWFRNGDPQADLPPTFIDYGNGRQDEAYVAILTKPDFNTAFISGVYHDYEDAAKFCGSGAEFAKDCYSANGCSMKCVDTAATHDPQTGGDVKFVDCNDLTNNLSQPGVRLEEMANQLVERGMVMDMKTKKVTPIKTGTASAQDVARASAHLLSAPTGQAPRAWTEREKHDVRKAMKHVLDLERAANS